MKKILILLCLMIFGCAEYVSAMADVTDQFFFLEKDGRLIAYSENGGCKLYWVSQSEIKDTVTLKQVLWSYGGNKYLANKQVGETYYKINKKGNIYSPVILGFKDFVYDKNGEPTVVPSTEKENYKILTVNKIPISVQDKLQPNVSKFASQFIASIKESQKPVVYVQEKDVEVYDDSVYRKNWFVLENEGLLLVFNGDLDWWSAEGRCLDIDQSLWRCSDNGYLINKAYGPTDYKYTKKRSIKSSYGYIHKVDERPKELSRGSIAAHNHFLYYFNRIPIVSTSGSFDAKSVEDSIRVVSCAYGAQDSKYIKIYLNNAIFNKGKCPSNFHTYNTGATTKASGTYMSVESVVAKGKEALDIIKSGSYYGTHYIKLNTPEGTYFLGKPLDLEFPANELTYANGYYKFKYTTREGGKIPCPDEDYGQPFDVCINGPINDYVVQVSPTEWIIDEKNQIQTTCRHGKGGHPIKPVFEEDGLAKLGTYRSNYSIFGNLVPSTVTCSRRMYQTPRTRKRTSRGGTVIHTMYGTDGDPFAPWRVVQNRHHIVDAKALEKQVGIPLNVLALLSMVDDCENFGLIASKKFTIMAALYKAYKLHDTAKLRADVLATAKKLETNGRRLESMQLYSLLGDEKSVARLCDSVFIACQTPTDLVQAFNGVYRIIKRDNNVDGRRCLFAGIKRFDDQPLDPRSVVNLLHPDAEKVFFKEFWPKQETFCYDLSYLPQFDEYVAYLKSCLSESCYNPNYIKLLKYTDKEQVMDVISYIENFLTVELLSIWSQLLQKVSVEEFDDIKRRVDTIEVLAKQIGMRNIKEAVHYDQSVDFQLRRIRARIDRFCK